MPLIDIGDGTEVSVDQFYREDLFNAVVVALKHRLQCCFESDDPDMFRELQVRSLPFCTASVSR